MALRNLVYDNDPFIKKTSKTVTDFDDKLWELLDDMRETMEKNNGCGLAAIQVGVLKRIIIIEINNQFLELINPEIIKESGNQCGVEGCLSVKNIQGYVNRPKEITVKAQDRYGNKFTISGENELAVVLSHEIDHTFGILFTSKMVKIYVPQKDDDLTPNV